MAEKYLFSWEDIKANDSFDFIESLIKNFGVNWARTAKIEKVEDDMTVNVSAENNFLSIKLNNKKNRATLTIPNVKAIELIVKIEKGKLNIYYERKYLRMKKCLICGDFVNLMFPEDAKNRLIVYEPVEGLSNESRNLKKKQLGYIHRACLDKAGSTIKK